MVTRPFFQGYNPLTNATALENIVLSMYISGSKVKDKKQYAYNLFNNVGIDKETADRKVLKLSGGLLLLIQKRFLLIQMSFGD